MTHRNLLQVHRPEKRWSRYPTCERRFFHNTSMCGCFCYRCLVETSRANWPGTSNTFRACTLHIWLQGLLACRRQRLSSANNTSSRASGSGLDWWRAVRYERRVVAYTWPKRGRHRTIRVGYAHRPSRCGSRWRDTERWSDCHTPQCSRTDSV